MPIKAVAGRQAIWVATIYFAASLPNVAVAELSKFLYNDMGLSVADQTLLTGAMYLPWVIKPLWSPVVDLFQSKRWWIVACQFWLCLAFLGLAMSLQLPEWLSWSAGFFWMIAFVSATHDIACDGFYMLGLDESAQAGMNGVRTVFYRLAAIAGKGGLIMLAGWLGSLWSVPSAWSAAMLVPALYLAGSTLYHHAFLPRPQNDVQSGGGHLLKNYAQTFGSFLRKPGFPRALTFMLLFRFAEGQMLAVVAPFLGGPRDEGSLGLSTADIGFAYGTCGSLGVIAGGVLAAWAVSRWGLRTFYWPMVALTHLPDLLFVWLALAQPDSLRIVSGALFLEQLGFGFGFSLYMLYLMYFSRGPQRTSHFALCTGLMALGGMLPQMIAGSIETALGFKLFYFYVLLCTVPGVWVAWQAWRDKDFINLYSPHLEDLKKSNNRTDVPARSS